MGRRKLIIQRLECAKARKEKYLKRKNGLFKKAEELATLCDVDLALLTFSPSGKPTLYVCHDKDLSTVLERLLTMSLGLREERRAYTLEKLIKKLHPDEDLEGDLTTILSFTDGYIENEMIKLQKDELQELQVKLAVKRRILRDWEDPQNVNNLSQIRFMEDHMVASLSISKIKKGHEYAFDLKNHALLLFQIQLQEQQKGFEAFLVAKNLQLNKLVDAAPKAAL